MPLPLPPVPARVVAAPMAGGPSTVALAAAVGEAGGNWVYRYEGDEITTATFNTLCASGNQADFVVAVSNLPTGDLAVLDASYDYSVVKRNK